MAPSPARLRRDEPMARRSRSRTPDRPSRLRLWLKRSRALLKPTALGLLGLGALGAAGIAIWAADPAGRVARLVDAAAALGRDGGLVLQEVALEGRRNTPIEMIRAALGASRGDPILAFSPEEAKERLETIPWIQHAHVERHLPGTIVIKLEERRPFAIWQNHGRFVIIDREGKVVATDRLDQFGPLPLVVGAGAEKHAAELYDLLKSKADVAVRVQALVRVGERRWNLRLHNGTDVLLPEGAEAAAVERLADLQAEHGLLDRPVVAIDMRLPDRLVVRAQPQEDTGPPQPQRSRSQRG